MNMNNSDGNIYLCFEDKHHILENNYLVLSFKHIYIIEELNFNKINLD